MTPLPPPDDLAVRFADGHMHEAAVVNLLETTWGAEILDSQLEVALDLGDLGGGANVTVRGHIDGIVGSPVILPSEDGDIQVPGPAVLEIKSLSQSSTEKWRREGFDGFPRYAVQISVYMIALGIPAVFVVKNKNSGQLTVRVVHTPPVSLEELADRVRVVEQAEDVMPVCSLSDFPCPYLYLHDEVSKKGVKSDVVEVEDPTLNLLAAEYEQARETERRAGAAKDEARDNLLGYLTQKGVNDGGLMTDLYKVTVRSRMRETLDRKRLEAAHPEIKFSTYMKQTNYVEVRVDPTITEG